MTTMKKTLILCALILGLTSNYLVSFAGMSAVLANSPQQFDRQITSFIEEAREASAAGERKTLVLTLSEEDVARKLTEMAERNKSDISIRVKDIQVQFRESSVHLLVKANVKYLIFSTKVGADVLITPEGKHGYYEVVDISTGYLPKTLVDWIMKRIPYELSGPLPLGDIPVELQDISVKDGRLYIKAITVPAQ